MSEQPLPIGIRNTCTNQPTVHFLSINKRLQEFSQLLKDYSRRNPIISSEQTVFIAVWEKKNTFYIWFKRLSKLCGYYELGINDMLNNIKRYMDNEIVYHGRFTQLTARFWLSKLMTIWIKVNSCYLFVLYLTTPLELSSFARETHFSMLCGICSY